MKAYALLKNSLLAATIGCALISCYDPYYDHFQPDAPPRDNFHQPNPGPRADWGRHDIPRHQPNKPEHHPNMGGHPNKPEAHPRMKAPRNTGRPSAVTPSHTRDQKHHDKNRPNKNRPSQPQSGHMHRPA